MQLLILHCLETTTVSIPHFKHLFQMDLWKSSSYLCVMLKAFDQIQMMRWVVADNQYQIVSLCHSTQQTILLHCFVTQQSVLYIQNHLTIQHKLVQSECHIRSWYLATFINIAFPICCWYFPAARMEPSPLEAFNSNSQVAHSDRGCHLHHSSQSSSWTGGREVVSSSATPCPL